MLVDGVLPQDTMTMNTDLSPIFETLGKCPLYLDSKAMASEL